MDQQAELSTRQRDRTNLMNPHLGCWQEVRKGWRGSRSPLLELSSAGPAHLYYSYPHWQPGPGHVLPDYVGLEDSTFCRLSWHLLLLPEMILTEHWTLRTAQYSVRLGGCLWKHWLLKTQRRLDGRVLQSQSMSLSLIVRCMEWAHHQYLCQMYRFDASCLQKSCSQVLPVQHDLQLLQQPRHAFFLVLRQL